MLSFNSFRAGALASSKSLAGGVIAGLVLTIAGCGGEPVAERAPVHPVEGSITFKGQPMPGAVIAFHPKTPLENVPPPRGSVNADGSLKVSTYDGGDGAPEGEYVLTVQWYKLVKNGADVTAGPNVVPRKYAAPSTSDIVVKIAAGTNALPPIRL